MRRGAQPRDFPRIKPGRFSRGRFKWITFPSLELILMKGDPDDEAALEPDGGLSTYLRIKAYGGKETYVPLSSYTLEEITAMQQFFNETFELVKPQVEALDRLALEAFNNGDDSFARLYRPVPQIFDRKQPTIEHGEGVHNGSEADAPDDGDAPDD